VFVEAVVNVTPPSKETEIVLASEVPVSVIAGEEHTIATYPAVRYDTEVASVEPNRHRRLLTAGVCEGNLTSKSPYTVTGVPPSSVPDVGEKPVTEAE
jgi:hypothetical protein